MEIGEVRVKGIEAAEPKAGHRLPPMRASHTPATAVDCYEVYSLIMRVAACPQRELQSAQERPKRRRFGVSLALLPSGCCRRASERKGRKSRAAPFADGGRRAGAAGALRHRRGRVARFHRRRLRRRGRGGAAAAARSKGCPYKKKHPCGLGRRAAAAGGALGAAGRHAEAHTRRRVRRGGGGRQGRRRGGALEVRSQRGWVRRPRSSPKAARRARRPNETAPDVCAPEGTAYTHMANPVAQRPPERRRTRRAGRGRAPGREKIRRSGAPAPRGSMARASRVSSRTCGTADLSV